MIEVAAVVFRNSFGHVLTVRKDSSTKFQLPGGKLEAGETPHRPQPARLQKKSALTSASQSFPRSASSTHRPPMNPVKPYAGISLLIHAPSLPERLPRLPKSHG